MTNLIVFSLDKASRGHQQILNETTFCAWLAQAEPGETLEYHRGFLSLDRGGFENTPKNDPRNILNLVANRTYDLAKRGFIHLTQRRIAPETFSYRAVARPLPEGQILDSTTLMSEEAA